MGFGEFAEDDLRLFDRLVLVVGEQRQQAFGEPRQVPLRDARLVGIGVAAALIDRARTPSRDRSRPGRRTARSRWSRRRSSMLSVFITPWMKPTRSQRATSVGLRGDDALEQRSDRARSAAQLRIVPGDDVVGEVGAAPRCRRARRRTGRCRRGCGSRPRASAPRRAAASRARRGSPVVTAASARVVGMPNAPIASLTMYSRKHRPERGAAVAAAARTASGLRP